MAKKNFCRTSCFLLVICLCLCLISGIGARAVSSSGGDVTIKKVSYLTPEGFTVSGLMYIPKSATAENKAPAVVTVHGWYNTNAFQDLFNVELSRRGYVVLSCDMIGHGESEITEWAKLYDDASGIYSSVKFIAGLDFVDTTRIGLTGHSSGGDMAAAAVGYDQVNGTNLIRAVLFQSSQWIDDQGIDHIDRLGSRYAGVIATAYDEFFYGDTPREFIGSDMAEQFLTYNYTKELDSAAEPGVYYPNEVEGTECARVIYTPQITHPREHFSRECVGYALEFFDKALDTPNKIAYNSQVWPVGTAFKALGLVSWIFVFVFFALTMLDTAFFSTLKVREEAGPIIMTKDPKAHRWFWLPLVGFGILNAALFMWIQHKLVIKPTYTNFWPQSSTLGVAVWALVSGIVSLCIFTAYYKTYGKDHGFDLREKGLIIAADKIGKTILLAVLTVVVGFSVLYANDYFFDMDYRLFLVAARPFGRQLFYVAVRFLPFFVIGQTINSMIINGPFYTNIGSKRWKYGNLVICILGNCIGFWIFLAMQYGYFHSTGMRLFAGSLGIQICFIWMGPVLFNTIVTSILSRKIYMRSGNPYIAGIINGLIVTFVQCASTCTVLWSATIGSTNGFAS